LFFVCLFVVIGWRSLTISS